MIAKRIMSPKGGAGFSGLARYVVNARSGVDPASWERLGAYILDENGQGEKVAWARVSNCQSDDPGWAVKEILAVQMQNTRSKSDKSYHLVVSFPEGERPTREQIEDVEDRLVASLGFDSHHRISAVHQNTDNWHLHVAINKVHPVTFRNVTPIRDHYRLQEGCAELEVKHGLTREPHTVDRAASRARGKGRAADFEAQTGAPAFITWIRDNAAPELLAARDSGQGWDGVHEVAARFDLVLKPRGAGLVFSHRTNGRLHVKASSVDRGLSLAALTSALGSFQPAQGKLVEAEASYTKPEANGPLYARFQTVREAAMEAREAALRELRTRQAKYGHDLRAYHRQRFRDERLTGLRGTLRRESYAHLVAQRKRDMAELRKREAAERKKVHEQHSLPRWQGWLEHQAGLGNEDALKTLRDRLQRREMVEGDLLQAADATEARHVIHRHLRPAVRRDGRVIYRIDDGGLVSDEKAQIRVNQVTAGATFLALSLAADRFGSKPLKVNGTDDFRRQVAEWAGTQNLKVTFADQSLEEGRKAAAILRPRPADRGIGLERD